MKRHRCPFCAVKLPPMGFLEKIGPALYAYRPCGCAVQFTAQGYPRKPKK